MTAALIAIAVALGAGSAAAFAARRPLGSETVGEAWLLGIGICAGTLFALAAARIPWSLPLALAAVVAVSIVLAIVGTRRIAPTEPRIPAAFGAWSALFDTLTAITVAGYTLIATAGPIAEIDFIAAWGLKARMFWIARGIDWRFLENPWYRWIHADYPPLVPLSFDWVALFQGHWDDRLLGALNTCFALALLLVVRALLEEEIGSATYAAFVTLAVAPLAVSPWIGIGEGPLLAYGTTGVLLLRRAVREPARSLEYASLFLGLAAATKNEGLALLVAAAVAVVVSDRRAAVWRLWPAAAIATPWLIARAVHTLPTDLARGDAIARIAAHLQEPMLLVRAIASQPTGHRWFWIGVAVALLLGIARIVREERFVLVTVALVVAFDLTAYLATSQDVVWLVRWSWERLVAQVSVVTGFIASVQIYRDLRGSTSAGSPIRTTAITEHSTETSA